MKRGLLRKNPVSSTFGASKDRYFVLEPARLVYFEKEGALVPKGTFELNRWSETLFDGEMLTVSTGQQRLVLRASRLVPVDAATAG